MAQKWNPIYHDSDYKDYQKRTPNFGKQPYRKAQIDPSPSDPESDSLRLPLAEDKLFFHVFSSLGFSF